MENDSKYFKSVFINFFPLILNTVLLMAGVFIFIGYQIIYPLIFFMFTDMMISFFLIFAGLEISGDDIIITYFLFLKKITFKRNEIMKFGLVRLPWHTPVKIKEAGEPVEVVDSSAPNGIYFFLSSGRQISVRTNQYLEWFEFLNK
ncbi:MAG: hypothetical protein PHV06_10585 [bacterium]|nr:hypothetical protein [bacterium]